MAATFSNPTSGSPQPSLRTEQPHPSRPFIHWVAVTERVATAIATPRRRLSPVRNAILSATSRTLRAKMPVLGWIRDKLGS